MLNSSDWFDTDTSLTGTLTSDYIQEVHIDGGQKVKKVYVKKGDKVKKGDILLKYNVSEKELDLKLQKLQIQSSKMEIAEMEKELKKLKNTKTVVAVNTGNSDVMNASVNLSAIKGTSLSYLVAEADKNEGTTIATGGEGKTGSDTGSENGSGSGNGTGTESGSGSGSGTGTENGSGSGSGTGTESGSGSGSGTGTENGSGSGSGTGTESGSGSGSGTGTESGSESGSESGKDDKNPEPKENINSLEDASGTGTKDDKYIFNLKKGGKVSGSVIKQLKDKGENGYAVFREHDGEDTSTYTLTPEKLSNINVKESKMYSVEELKNGGDENNVSSDESYIKGSGTKEDPYVYNLNINGSILGDVIQKLIKDGKYAKFVEYESEQQTGKMYVLTPDTAFRRDIVSEENYTIASLNELTKASYTDLPKAITSIDDKDDYDSSDEKYVYYLSDNGVIKGSVIKELIKSKKSAEFISYASEKDYKVGTKQFTLSINANTKFKNTLLDSTQYAISDLIDNIQKVDPSKPTTEHENPTTPSTDKKIKFKQNRKRVTAGNGCLLTVVTEDGKSIDQSKVTWKLSDNISKDTTITKTKSGVWLYVDEGEPSSSVTITAQVKNVKGISKEQISRTLIVKGADTGDDGDDNNGGGSDDGSGSGSGDGIDDGTDSSGGDDNGYTAEELKAAISDKEDDIAQAKEDLHDAQISYKEAKAEVDKATVKAKLAGTVTTAYSKGTLPTDGSAAIVVKAADGMYVKTSISEMELDSVKVGGTIKCVSSDTGDEYTAEVKEISDFPTADSSNGGDVSNPNSSYYPIVAFIKDADGLSPGGSVEVSYSSKSMGTANENAVYLQKAYIRTEDKKSYVYLRDKKTKRLKKQYITIGKTMNGQYIEIVSGVTEDDNIAFPYGKNLREGVKTKISEDDSEMIY